MSSWRDLTGDDAKRFWKSFKRTWDAGNFTFIRMDGENVFFNLYLYNEEKESRICVSRNTYNPRDIPAYYFKFQEYERRLSGDRWGDEYVISEPLDPNVYDEVSEWWEENGSKFARMECEKHGGVWNSSRQREFYNKLTIPDERWIANGVKGTGASFRPGVVTIDNLIWELRRYKQSLGGEFVVTDDFILDRLDDLRGKR